MHLHKLLSRHGLGTFQYLARAFISTAHFALLLLGQRHDAQGKDLVYLSAIEKIAALSGAIWG